MLPEHGKQRPLMHPNYFIVYTKDGITEFATKNRWAANNCRASIDGAYILEYYIS